MQKQHLSNIDFFRFYLAIGIIFLHLIHIGFGPEFSQLPEQQKLALYVGKAGYGVDIFFVIAGFFIVYTGLYKYQIQYIILKRALRLWPTMIGCLAIAFVLHQFHLCNFYGMQNLYSVLFLNGIRIANHTTGEYPGLGNLHSSWFLSSLMFSTILYCSLLKFYRDRFTFFTIVICVMCWYQASYNINILFFNSVLRGLGSVGLGCLIGLAYERIKSLKATPNSISTLFRSVLFKLFLTGIQICLLITLSVGLFADYKNRFVMTDFIVIFSLLFILLLINQDYLSRILNNSISSKLGKYAFSIYLSHCITIDVLKNTIINKNDYFIFKEWLSNVVDLSQMGYFTVYFLINSAICIGVGIVVYYIFESRWNLIVPQWIPRS